MKKCLLFHMEVCWNWNTKAPFRQLKRHVKYSWIGNPNGEIMPWYLFYMLKKQNLKKSKISIFGEFSKFLRFNWFGADFENKWAYTAVWAVLGSFQIVFSNFDCEYLLKYEESWSMKWLFRKVCKNSTILKRFQLHAIYI